MENNCFLCKTRNLPPDQITYAIKWDLYENRCERDWRSCDECRNLQIWPENSQNVKNFFGILDDNYMKFLNQDIEYIKNELRQNIFEDKKRAMKSFNETFKELKVIENYYSDKEKNIRILDKLKTRSILNFGRKRKEEEIKDIIENIFDKNLIFSPSCWDNSFANEQLIKLNLGHIQMKHLSHCKIVDIAFQSFIFYIITEETTDNSIYHYKFWKFDNKRMERNYIYDVKSEKLNYRVLIGMNVYFYAEGGSKIRKLDIFKNFKTIIDFFGEEIQTERKILKVAVHKRGLVDIRLWLGEIFICRTDDPFERIWKQSTKNWKSSEIYDINVCNDKIIVLYDDILITLDINSGCQHSTLPLSPNNFLAYLPFAYSFNQDMPILIGRDYICVVEDYQMSKIFLVKKYFNKFQQISTFEEERVLVNFTFDDSWCISKHNTLIHNFA